MYVYMVTHTLHHPHGIHPDRYYILMLLLYLHYSSSVSLISQSHLQVQVVFHSSYHSIQYSCKHWLAILFIFYIQYKYNMKRNMIYLYPEVRNRWFINWSQDILFCPITPIPPLYFISVHLYISSCPLLSITIHYIYIHIVHPRVFIVYMDIDIRYGCTIIHTDCGVWTWWNCLEEEPYV